MFRFAGLKHKPIYNDTRNIMRGRNSHVERVAVFTHPTVHWNSMKFPTVMWEIFRAPFAWKPLNAVRIWNSTLISIPEIGPTSARTARKHVSENELFLCWFAIWLFSFIDSFFCIVASSGNCFSHRKRVHSDKSEVPATTIGGSKRSANTVENSKKLMKAWVPIDRFMQKRPKFSFLQNFITNLSKSCFFKEKKWIKYCAFYFLYFFPLF